MLIKDLKPNADNPRTITQEKLDQLKKALIEFGDLSGIVYNRKTKQLCGGHQRLKSLDPDAPITILKQYKKATKTGTMAEGFVELKGERFSYREVAWPEKKEKAANIAANKGAGEWDLPKLDKWLKELKGKFDLNLTMFDGLEILSHLQDVEKINSGNENDEWAQMEEVSFVAGKNIQISLQFKTEKAREEYADKHKLHVAARREGAWIVKLWPDTLFI